MDVITVDIPQNSAIGANITGVEVNPKIAGATVHNELTGRDAADQHPVSAIAGLQKELDGKQPSGNYLTEDNLQNAVDTALAQAKSSGEFDGPEGPKGDDGYSPTISVSDIDGGHRVSVTDVEGEKHFDVMDAESIVVTSCGESIVLNDSAAAQLRGLAIFGKTTQDGMPTITNPRPLENAGSGGDIKVSISDGTNESTQILTVQTPNGLPGIPVTSGGNYTDENGQQWACDEIDFERGVYVQRVHTFAGLSLFNTNSGFSMYQEICNYAVQSGANASVITHLPLSSCAYHNEYTSAHYWIENGRCRIWLPEGTNAEGLKAIGVLVNPIETPLTAAEIAAYKVLHTNKPVTTILNDDGVSMIVVYYCNTKVGNLVKGFRLPTVTTHDEGKFLRVVDGVWAATTIPNAEEESV